MNGCTDYWHEMPLYMRAPRCTRCAEIHPNGIVIEGEYLKMLRGKPYKIVYNDHEEVRESSIIIPKIPGETVVSQATYVICRSCGCIVTDTGLCTYDCKYDATHHSRRPPESMIIRVWERTDKLVEEREYVRKNA